MLAGQSHTISLGPNLLPRLIVLPFRTSFCPLLPQPTLGTVEYKLTCNMHESIFRRLQAIGIYLEEKIVLIILILVVTRVQEGISTTTQITRLSSAPVPRYSNLSTS